MSKYLSREQELNYGSRLLKADELHKSVMQIWADERNLPAITRSFSGHHQMVMAILDNKGDNNYLSERGGISFGIRKKIMTSLEGDGVIMVPEPQREGESIQEEILNHMRIRKLRYNVPKTTTLTKARLSQQQNDLLAVWMDYERMEDDVFDSWDTMGEEEEVGFDDNE